MAREKDSDRKQKEKNAATSSDELPIEGGGGEGSRAGEG
jgi:hypothetical protein